VKVGVYHPPIHPRHFGGSIAVTLPIVNELEEQGYQVIMLVNDKIHQNKFKEVFGEEVSHQAKAIMRKPVLKPQNMLDLYENAFKLLSLKMKCDVVIDTYSDYIFPWCNVSYVHFPYINNITFKQRFPYIRKQRRLENVVNLPYVFLSKNTRMSQGQLLFTNSLFTSRTLEEALGLRSKVLYPPIARLFYQQSSNSGADQREDLVVTVGRINLDKRLEVIPKIASMLKDKNAKFVITGFAHSENALNMINREIQRLDVAKNVSVKLNLPKEELNLLLRRAKVYLHTPTLEHFGISIAEAMACGCLPVAYDDGGAPEFVPDGLRYKTLEEAAEMTRNALNQWNPEKAKAMTAIAENFSEPNYRKNFMRMFTDYLRNGAKGQ
jgi:glycosyltransferase involved in cell wall biosynthesis